MERLKKWIAQWNQQPLLKKMWTLAACALIFLVEGREHLEKHFLEKVRVIAAKRELAPGGKITLQDLTVTLVAKQEWVENKLFGENRLHHLIGRELKSAILEGEPLTEKHLENMSWPIFSKRIPKGHRAYLIRTNHLLPLETGDRVDVVAGNIPGNEATELFVEDRQVLGVKSAEDSSEVLLAVLPEEVPRLQEAQKEGELKLLLRNPKDPGNSASKKKRPKADKQKAKVEIWEVM